MFLLFKVPSQLQLICNMCCHKPSIFLNLYGPLSLNVMLVFPVWQIHYLLIKPGGTQPFCSLGEFVPDIYAIAELAFGSISGCSICFLPFHTIPFSNMDSIIPISIHNLLYSHLFAKFVLHIPTFTGFLCWICSKSDSVEEFCWSLVLISSFSSSPCRRQKSRKWLRVVTGRHVRFLPSSWSSWGSRRTAHMLSAPKSPPCRHRRRSWTPKWRWLAPCPLQPR